MGKDVEVVYQKGRDGNEGEEGKNQENIIAEERRIPRVFDREMEDRYERMCAIADLSLRVCRPSLDASELEEVTPR